MRKQLNRLLVLAVFAVPVENKGEWQILSFNKIPANKVSFSDAGLKLEVKKSSSPLIYPLAKPMSVTNVSVEADIQGEIDIPEGKTQGAKGVDDFALKLGLVVRGEKTLSWLMKKVAADWVITLFNLAPKGMGVDHIQFINLVEQKALVGTSREHPLKKDLLKEKMQWLRTGDGPVKLAAPLDAPKEVLALWISCDGDDTNSSFDITLKSIELTTQ